MRRSTGASDGDYVAAGLRNRRPVRCSAATPYQRGRRARENAKRESSFASSKESFAPETYAAQADCEGEWGERNLSLRIDNTSSGRGQLNGQDGWRVRTPGSDRRRFKAARSPRWKPAGGHGHHAAERPTNRKYGDVDIYGPSLRHR